MSHSRGNEVDPAARVPPRRRRRAAVVDVAVVGGGMVGASAALALARVGLSVTLVEAREPRPWRAEDEVDLRVVALAPSSARLLNELGVWNAICAARVQPYRHMHVWDAANGAAIDFDAADIGRQFLGWIAENRLLQSILWDALTDAGVQRLCPASVEGFVAGDDHVHVQLAGGDPLDARLLVAADGAASPLRQQAGIAMRQRDYGQRAVVAHVATERCHQDTAWQRFLPGGPVALLPLSDARSSVVWSLPEAEAQRVLALDDAGFMQALGVATDFCLGRVMAATARAAFPLRMQLAQVYQADRLVLLGDAAHVVHPLAGQGVNLGLRDVVELRDSLCAAQAAGRDMGAHTSLRRYARRRRSADTLDAWGIDMLDRLFSGSAATPKASVRELGIRACNDLDLIKRVLSDRASGTVI
ncbi:MAG TPA: FAD-dependent oxidoreductase [Rhodanobacteraceae bacterium]